MRWERKLVPTYIVGAALIYGALGYVVATISNAQPDGLSWASPFVWPMTVIFPYSNWMLLMQALGGGLFGAETARMMFAGLILGLLALGVGWTALAVNRKYGMWAGGVFLALYIAAGPFTVIYGQTVADCLHISWFHGRCPYFTPAADQPGAQAYGP